MTLIYDGQIYIDLTPILPLVVLNIKSPPVSQLVGDTTTAAPPRVPDWWSPTPSSAPFESLAFSDNEHFEILRSTSVTFNGVKSRPS